MAASFYRPKCVTRLSADAIERLYLGRLHGMYQELTRLIPGFEAFPDPIQCATLDIAFNMGVPVFKNSFPSYVGHARAGNFSGMLAECDRKEDSDNAKRRNEWTRAQFKKVLG
jgi:hypothetical protein